MSRLVEQHCDVIQPTVVRLLRRLKERVVLSESKRGTRGQRDYGAQEMMAAVAGE